MRGRGYGVCILGLSLRAMVASKRVERPRSKNKDPTNVFTRPPYLSPRVYKPTNMQPTVSLQVIRLAGAETYVNIPVSVLVLRFATNCLDYPLCAYLFTLFLIRFVFLHITGGV
jgi:hypothetical protein